MTASAGYTWTLESEALNDRYTPTESGEQTFTAPVGAASETVQLGTPRFPRNTPFAGGATVRWNAANDGNSRHILEYEVRYRERGASVPGPWQTRKTKDTSYRISGLNPSLRYEWQVRSIPNPQARDRQNRVLTISNYADSDFFVPGQTDADPGNPNIVGQPSGLAIDWRRSNGARLRWVRPADSQRTGLAGFRVDYRKKGAAQWTPKRVGSLTVATEITGLDTLTEYEWQVTSLGTRIGTQFYQSSEPVSGPNFTTAGSGITIAGGKIGTPTNPVSREATYNGVGLGWTPPTQNAVGIASYHVEYQLQGDREWTDGGSFSATSGYLNGLQSSSTYLWRVTAVAIQGFEDSAPLYGTFTTTARSITLLAPASVIRDVTYTPGHGNLTPNIRVRLFTGSQPSLIARRQIQARLGSSTTWVFSREIDGAGTGLGFEPPIYNTTYRFRARSIGTAAARNSGWTEHTTPVVVGNRPAESDRPSEPRPPNVGLSPEDVRIRLSAVRARSLENAISLTWGQASPLAALARYDVYYRPTGATPDIRWRRLNISRTSFGATLSGLATDEQYNIRVIGRANSPPTNISGTRYIDSEFSNLTHSTLDTGVAPPPPGIAPLSEVIVTLTPGAGGNGEMGVSWTAATPDSNLREYRVFHRLAGGTFPATGIRVAKGIRTHTLTGLNTGREYEVYVRAVPNNAAQNSESNSQIVSDTTTRSSTDTKTNVTLSASTLTATANQTSGNFSLSWTAATPSAGVRGYAVQVRVSGGNWQSVTANQTSRTRAVSLASAQQLTGSSTRAFEFQVRANPVAETATHRYFQSAWSNTASASSSEDEEDTPTAVPSLSSPDLTDLTAGANGNGEATATWEASVPNANLREYRVFHRKIGEAYPSTGILVAKGTTTYTFTGLDTGTNYTAYIRAVSTNEATYQSADGTARSVRTTTAGQVGPQPTLLSPPDLSVAWDVPTQTYALTWTNDIPSGLTGFNQPIQVRAGTSGSWQTLFTGNETRRSYNAPLADAQRVGGGSGRTFYFRVMSVSTRLDYTSSDWSNEETAEALESYGKLPTPLITVIWNTDTEMAEVRITAFQNTRGSVRGYRTWIQAAGNNWVPVRVTTTNKLIALRQGGSVSSGGGGAPTSVSEGRNIINLTAEEMRDLTLTPEATSFTFIIQAIANEGWENSDYGRASVEVGIPKLPTPLITAIWNTDTEMAEVRITAFQNTRGSVRGYRIWIQAAGNNWVPVRVTTNNKLIAIRQGGSVSSGGGGTPTDISEGRNIISLTTEEMRELTLTPEATSFTFIIQAIANEGWENSDYGSASVMIS